MLTYIAGPILAFLPRRWRKAVGSSGIRWSRATALSGLVEFVLCVMAAGKWYYYSMTTWVNRGLEAALNGQAGPGVTDHAIGAMALLIWATHPLTWALAYFGFEGAVRFCCAAFGDSYLGTLPLFFVDKVYAWIMGVPPEDPDRPAIAASFVSAVSDKLLESTQLHGPDEIVRSREGGEELMEIRASRKKADWEPPRVVRIGERFYRLERFTKGAPPRPFRYTLRRLAAGVMSRTVLVYDAEPEAAESRR